MRLQQKLKSHIMAHRALSSRRWQFPVCMKYVFTVSLTALLFSVACSSRFNKLEYLNDYENLALYRLKAREYPPRGSKIKKQMSAMKEFPPLGPEQIIDLLGNFEYVRDSYWGRVQRRVFYKDELEYMAPFISQQLTKLGSEYRLVIVSRFDPDKSVLSRMERVSALLWIDEEGYNVVFGEIRTEIPQNDFLVDTDEWKNVYPVSLNRAYHDLSLVKGDFFQKKEIDGKIHETWAQISEEKLATLRYKPLEQQKKIAAPTSEDISERLKSLQKAKDEGLITEEEFQAKRKQMLDSF